MNSVRSSFARAGLVRSRNSKVLGGVCAGLGRRFDIEPVPARWLFVIALLVIPGSQILVYPALWFCMPLEGSYAEAPVAAQPAA